uniref:Bicaudal D homolog 1a n=1 Tax=Hucho hucho TaxID=62062 RepID=A0A4W5R4I5_9TELE
MAAGGGCGETVDQYRAEVERLTQELAEANREKIRAAECGLVVLEENQTLKQQYADLESEQETLKQELEQLQECLDRSLDPLPQHCWASYFSLLPPAPYRSTSTGVIGHRQAGSDVLLWLKAK